MKKLLIVILPLIFTLPGCNGIPCDPCDSDEFNDRIEFYHIKCLDDSCNTWEEILLDTIEGGAPKIRVIIKERLYAGDSVNLFVVYNQEDTITQVNLKVRENDTRHIYYMTSLRLNYKGNYYAYAYYVAKGIKKELPPEVLVYK